LNLIIFSLVRLGRTEWLLATPTLRTIERTGITVSAPTNVLLRFEQVGNDNRGVVLDNIIVTSSQPDWGEVPEPSTFVMLTAGLLLVACRKLGSHRRAKA
jgi:hypothetical protein